MQRFLMAVIAVGCIALGYILWVAFTATPDAPFVLEGTYNVQRWVGDKTDSTPDITGTVQVSPRGPGWSLSGIIDGKEIQGTGMYADWEDAINFSISNEDKTSFTAVDLKYAGNTLTGVWQRHHIELNTDLEQPLPEDVGTEIWIKQE